MYRDGYQESGWIRFLRWISASFRLGRFFGVEVRVYWLTLVVLPLWALGDIGAWTGSFVETIAHVVTLTVGLYLVVWTHEMGHILAGRRYGIWTPLITLSPLGGLAHMSSPAPNPRADVWISLAGPAVHLIWLAVVWPLAAVVDYDTLRPAGWTLGTPYYALETLKYVNLVMMVFNLIPFFPLDGGRVLRALLTMRLDPWRATVIACRIGQIGAVVFAIAGLVIGELRGSILLLIGISGFLACMQELRLARFRSGPYEADPRMPWEQDPDAWKGGGGAAVASSRATSGGRPSRWRRTRRAESTPRRDDQDATLTADVDRVLDRVNQVGMAGLTKEERRILERAAKARRKPGGEP